MIYLIDDKKPRQKKDFGWTEEKILFYIESLCPIYEVRDLEANSKDIFKENNVVLYHESFLDNTILAKESAVKRDKLEEFAKKYTSFKLVFFSGSKNSRELNNNIAYLPVSVVYQNLRIFIEKIIEGVIDLNYLAFGENPQIESELIKQLDSSIQNIEREPAVIQHSKNLFIATDVKDIQNPIIGATIVTLFNEESDEELSVFLKDNIDNEEYNNIFIPICFGHSLSDYNGLRLATHIRCTKSKNQLSKLFLYSFVGMDYLFKNEYFNILKTLNVELVDFSKRAFEVSSSVKYDTLKYDELPREISKLKLNPPVNYEDSHSISNEWAIYQWTQTIGLNVTDELKDIFNTVNSNIYFKYLQTLNPVLEVNKISNDQLRIEYKGYPRALLIDDESQKGWYEIFAYILGDLNGIYIDYIGEELKNYSPEEIIKKSIQKIKDDEIDLVFLDFRLHQKDFSTNNFKEITGLKLLKEIKDYNPGIRVIIFSATNKIWNLIELQNTGANGFILKESPELETNNYNLETLDLFTSSIQEQLKYQFQKHLFVKLKEIKLNLQVEFIEENVKYNELIKGLKKQLGVIYTAIEKIDLERNVTLDIAFLSCYNFLELFKVYYLNEGKDYRYYLGYEETQLRRYWVSNNPDIVIDKGEYNRSIISEQPSLFNTIASLLIDYFKVSYSPHDEVVKLKNISVLRNDYIHGDKLSFDQNELKLIIDILELSTRKIKE